MKALRFLGGFVLLTTLLLAAVLAPALQTQRFEDALLRTVSRQAAGVTEADLTAFAQETMAYLRGEKAAWEPALSLNGVPAAQSIAPAFRSHMAQVRSWAEASPRVLAAGFALAAILLLASRGAGRRMYLWGVYAAAGLVLGVLLWAALDFESLWMLLHRTLIPDGIFAAGEPVMQLFPLELFLCYVQPVALAAAVHTALALAASLLLKK